MAGLLPLLLLAAAPTAPVPDTSPTTWVAADDYPPEALRANEEGRVRYTLALDRTGAIAGCTVTESSGSAALDTTTCRLITRRAHFAPAHDAGGRAMPSTYAGAFRWVIPREALANQLMSVRVRMDHGRIVSCAEPGASGDAEPPRGCDTYARPALLREIVGAAYDAARAIDVTLSMTVGDHAPPLAAGRRFVVADALFTLGEGGGIAGCRLRTAAPLMAKIGDLCAFATALPTKLDGRPGDTFTVMFAATVE